MYRPFFRNISSALESGNVNEAYELLSKSELHINTDSPILKSRIEEYKEKLSDILNQIDDLDAEIQITDRMYLKNEQ